MEHDYINWIVKRPEEKYKLNPRDRTLLKIVSTNPRIPLKKIAKKMRLSKVAVFNRIRKLEKKGIITGYSCFIDLGKLGFKTYQIGIKTNMGIEEKEDYVKRMGNCGFVNQILKISGGRWDFLIRLVVNDESFNESIDLITEEKIERIDILEVKKGLFYIHTDKVIEFFSSINKEKLDKKDVQLLYELAKNSKQKIIDLYKKLHLSPHSIIKNMKKLEKNKIILCYVSEFNPFIYGHEAYMFFIFTKDKKIQEKLSKELSQTHSTGILMNYQYPDIISYHIVSNLEELKEIEEIIKKYSNKIRFYEITRIEEQTMYHFFPKALYDLLMK